MKNRTWLTIIISAVVLIYFAAFAILAWQLELFNFTGTEESAKIVAAALTVVGGLFTTSATVIGILLKYSMDQRNADLRIQAENRLKLEAGVKAMELLSNTDKDLQETLRPGVIFTLVNLGAIELAVTLLGLMIREKKIDSATVDLVIDRALQSDSEIAQVEALGLLKDVACDLLVDKGNFRFPKCILDWQLTIPRYIRYEGFYLSMKQLMSIPCNKLDKESLECTVEMLIKGWQKERHASLKTSVGFCLGELLQLYPDDFEWNMPNQTIITGELKKKLPTFEKHRGTVYEYDVKQVADISDWRKAGKSKAIAAN